MGSVDSARRARVQRTRRVDHSLAFVFSFKYLDIIKLVVRLVLVYNHNQPWRAPFTTEPKINPDTNLTATVPILSNTTS